MKYKICKIHTPQEIPSLQPMGNLVILYAPSDLFIEYAHVCQQTFNNIELIGCSTHKNLCREGFTTDVLLIFLSDVEVSTYCLEDIGTYPILHIEALENTLKKISTTPADSTICFSLCTFTSHEEMVLNTIKHLLLEHHIDLIGGTAATDSNEVSYVLLNDTIKTDACILTLIHNLSGKIKLYKENIFHPTHEWFIATDVDVDKRLLKELNNQPSIEVMQKLLNDSQIDSHFLSHPLGLVLNDDVYIVSGKQVHSNGIEYFSNIYKNATLCTMELGDYKSINEITISNILKDIPHPKGTLAINCILRTIQFENEHFDKTFTSNLSKLGPFAGFSSFGEQIHYHHCNQTLVLAVFE